MFILTDIHATNEIFLPIWVLIMSKLWYAYLEYKGFTGGTMTSIDKISVAAMRVLAAEAIQKAKSGHPGMAIGAAPVAYAIWKSMRHTPKTPDWVGRDRFVLSAGHASMLEYTLLHFYGYGITMEDIKNFRQLNSKTPGHPEYGQTVGVEASTGPLGQGFAMAVGMAAARAHLAARFNREGYPIFDNYTYVLLGDGCMMEGISYEAASFAGAMKLDHLIAVYDSNHITIEGSTDITFTENVAARFVSCGWKVITVADGNDIDAMEKALSVARGSDAPVLIIVETKIANGTPLEGSNKAHGAPLGEENIRVMKENYGWEHEPFTIPQEIYDNFEAIAKQGEAKKASWDSMMKSYASDYPDEYMLMMDMLGGKVDEKLFLDESLTAFEGSVSTRSASGKILNILAGYLPGLIGGSADLGSSNVSELKGYADFSSDDKSGRNIHFGVRELAMAAICNGITLFGGLRSYCATFFVFSDYVKPALRLSALMGLPVTYIFTHDSIGVGEDGPTHQPIEQLAALRATPGVYTFRPADGKEMAAAYLTGLKLKAPMAIVASRQNLPTYEDTGAEASRGGYVLRRPKGEPDVLLIASGSEVQLIYKAADILAVQGYTAQLVSMPCMELFEEQDEAYKESVLPKHIAKRVACEAAATFGWERYTGIGGKVIGIDRFGTSAPADKVFAEYDITAEHIARAALELIREN